MLQNPGDFLPLDAARITKIAVVGPNADDPLSQLGDWSLGSGQTPAEHGTHPRDSVVTVLDGIRSRIGGTTQVSHVAGCGISSSDLSEIPAAVALASAADVVIAVVGDNIDFGGEYKPTATLEMQGGQIALLQALVETGKPLVVVLVNNKPLVLPEELLKNAAILECFNPGMQGGRAVAEILFGDVNPSGKLTISFARHVGQQPVFYSQVRGQHGDRYADLTQEPLFRFGTGLSYTRFTYTELEVLTPEISLEGLAQFTITLTNVGSRAGTEIAQLYVSDLVTSATWVNHRLQAFQRVALEAGESRRLTFEVSASDLWLVDAQGRYVVEPGEFQVGIGGSSSPVDLQKAIFHIVGQDRRFHQGTV